MSKQSKYQIINPNTVTFHVTGMQFQNPTTLAQARNFLLANNCATSLVNLVCEPTNPYDANAVQVHVNHNMIGYAPAVDNFNQKLKNAIAHYKLNRIQLELIPGSNGYSDSYVFTVQFI